MARTDYNKEDFEDKADPADVVQAMLEEIDAKLKAFRETNRDDMAAIRIDVGQSRRELIHMRSAIQRLQARFDNQLTVLVLSNLASGMGVAAIVLAATQGF